MTGPGPSPPRPNYNGVVGLTYSVVDGQGGILAASQTFNLAPVNDAPTGAVSIAGFAEQGQVLTADNTLADVDGLGEVAYQWQADGVDIEGATSNTLTLAQAQVGQAISVLARYTDGLGTPEEVRSDVTSPVANVNDLPTGVVTIVGSPSKAKR